MRPQFGAPLAMLAGVVSAVSMFIPYEGWNLWELWSRYDIFLALLNAAVIALSVLYIVSDQRVIGLALLAAAATLFGFTSLSIEGVFLDPGARDWIIAGAAVISLAAIVVLIIGNALAEPVAAAGAAPIPAAVAATPPIIARATPPPTTIARTTTPSAPAPTGNGHATASPASPAPEPRTQAPVAVEPPPQVAGLPPEGYYADPAGSPLFRRWTGSEWTDELRPRE